MKTGWKILLGVVGAIVLVVVGLCAGWLLWGRRVWASGTIGSSGMVYGDRERDDDCPIDEGYTAPTSGQISIEDAQEAVERYIKDWNADLEIVELIEFEQNFYAIVCEHDTGIGAMELLADKTSGIVSPEIGPNMMWNARYGMHRYRGMMNQSSVENSISKERAVEIAQTWLDENSPGVTAEEHADPFYGYYTIHTIKDGAIEGMLSVHGTTGQVWYHTWHGAFVQMIEMDDAHH